MSRFDTILYWGWTVGGTLLWLGATYFLVIGEYTHSIALMMFFIAVGVTEKR